MKPLTILIFSGDRFNINDLLTDIIKLNQSNLNVRVVEWSEDKKILKIKKKIYNSFKKKIKNFKVYFQKGNWEYKYSKFINKFKSKNILLLGDDDRINVSNFKKIYKYLNQNYSGITLSFSNFKTKKDLKKNNYHSRDRIRSFNLIYDLNKIGYTSCQIINVKLLATILKKKNEYLLKTKFPQNFLIMKLIKEYNNWKVLELNCIFNHLASFDDSWIKQNLLIRLKSEYLGYLIPIKKYFSNLETKTIKRIYFNLFFKNMISWIFLSIKYFGKEATFQSIKKERQILKEPFLIKLFLCFIYLSPFFILNYLRVLRRLFILKL
mgnify:CR=1 FL=1